MTSNFIISLAAEAIWIVLKVSAPMILLALAVGLIVSILQATTQIQEQTLAFVPKIVAVFIALLVFGEWILTVLVDFTSNLFNNLYLFIG
ncbi:flagellar biosynthesis protein FliQ [Chengkuizengella sediminis]|uniref:flagellar biosynthesis protein FliQ n=1 Tax=Chengkuizengella sediminis TaxID=1885917 RepID=UPI0013896433|nr:flagellar biosynthesis protein FliQ [Chengkuizengella sediminis]NDI33376.1 flagellar biosynthesis protein FliQ [Chengkuizengella sediminis]